MLTATDIAGTRVVSGGVVYDSSAHAFISAATPREELGADQGKALWSAPGEYEYHFTLHPLDRSALPLALAQALALALTLALTLALALALTQTLALALTLTLALTLALALALTPAAPTFTPTFTPTLSLTWTAARCTQLLRGCESSSSSRCNSRRGSCSLSQCR